MEKTHCVLCSLQVEGFHNIYVFKLLSIVFFNLFIWNTLKIKLLTHFYVTSSRFVIFLRI